ncbi:MAG TPA: hypothetical protein VFG04_24110 [Planctomycetaceae bacterium]|jgi:hypothetical protein|nr:hypothetical protein [Planctomycetaceae bacterium]
MTSDVAGREKNAADPARVMELAQQIVKLLSCDDSETRQRAFQTAMTALGESCPNLAAVGSLSFLPTASDENHSDLATFFSREGELKFADNALLCAAYHYSEYGNVPFSISEIQRIAADAGVILPDRPDMTFVQATKQGRKLFQRAGRGVFKPTATAGLMFGERWSVKAGRKPKAAATAMSD